MPDGLKKSARGTTRIRLMQQGLGIMNLELL